MTVFPSTASSSSSFYWLVNTKEGSNVDSLTVGVLNVCVFDRGAELFQATIVKAVRARLEEESKSVEQLKRQ